MSAPQAPRPPRAPHTVRHVAWATRLLAALAIASVTLVGLASPAGAAKINPSLTAVSLGIGGVQVVTVTLLEPIIGPGPEPAVVTIPLTNGDPTRLSLSTSELEWTASEWAQPRQVTLTALDNGIFDSSPTVLLTGVASSDSEFYDGFQISISVTVAESQPAPTTTTIAPSTTTTTVASTTTVAPSPSTTARPAVTPTTLDRAAVSPADAARLAETGADPSVLTVVAIVALTAGAALLVTARRRRP